MMSSEDKGSLAITPPQKGRTQENLEKKKIYDTRSLEMSVTTYH